MRALLCLAVLCAALAEARPVRAQRMQRTVQVSATVVDPAQVRVDALAAAVRPARGGVQLRVPLRVSGAGSPTVWVRPLSGTAQCSAVAAGPRGASWLRCFVPRAGTGAEGVAEGVTEVPVTLWVSTAS